jgi:hypothetical protein
VEKDSSALIIYSDTYQAAIIEEPGLPRFTTSTPDTRHLLEFSVKKSYIQPLNIPVTGPAGYSTVAPPHRLTLADLQTSPIPYDDKALMMAL